MEPATSVTPGSAEPVPARPVASVWRNRDYVVLLGGQVVSGLGSQVQAFALPLLVLAMSGSASEAGVVLSLGTFSYLVFGLFAGAFVDRWDRKRTMVVCDIGRAVITATVPIALWTHRLSLPQLCAVAVLSGMLQIFFDAADSASIANVVRIEQLSRALSYKSSASNALSIFGGMIAGALYGLARTVPFLLNAISYLVSAATLAGIRTRFQEDAERSKRNLVAEIRDGLRWLKNQPVIRFLTLIGAADSLRYGAGYLIIITLAQRVGASSSQIGFIFSGAAAGALVGALLAGRINERFPLGRVAVVMFWVEALTFPLYAVAPNWPLLACVAAGESLVAPIYGVAMRTYQLAITPDGLRGRVSSVTQTLSTGALSLGAAVGGVMIAGLGARSCALLFGGWLILLALITTSNGPVRRADTGRADTGRADTGRADTGRADTGRADTGRADTGAGASAGTSS